MSNRGYQFLLGSGIFFGLFFWTDVYALKSKNFYAAKKKQLQKKIVHIQKIINHNYREKKASIAYAHTLHVQIQMLHTLLQMMAMENQKMEKKIKDKKKMIQKLTLKEKKIAQEYAHMLNISVKKIQPLHQIFFVLSAQSFYQMAQRVQCLKQYARMRSVQMQHLQQIHKNLIVEKKQLFQKYQQKSQLIAQKATEQSKMQQRKQEQQVLLKRLQQQEKKLKKELKKNQQDIQKLDRIIKKIIAQAIEKKKTHTQAIQLTPAGKIISENFEKNKGKLPWPVKQGFIVGKFGRNQHPVLKNITTENLGIDIETTKNAKVYAVFQGIVKTVAFVPGMQKIIIIQHGNFHSVYARLQNTLVSSGATVDEKTVLGIVGTHEAGTSILHFQLWKNVQKFNPSLWLAR